jgi:hypothetical protein
MWAALLDRWIPQGMVLEVISRHDDRDIQRFWANRDRDASAGDRADAYDDRKRAAADRARAADARMRARKARDATKMPDT